MIKVIGKESCNRCEETKELLIKKKIPFTYQKLDDLSSQEKAKTIVMARKAGSMELPIIFKDNQIINIDELLKE